MANSDFIDEALYYRICDYRRTTNRSFSDCAADLGLPPYIVRIVYTVDSQAYNKSMMPEVYRRTLIDKEESPAQESDSERRREIRLERIKNGICVCCGKPKPQGAKGCLCPDCALIKSMRYRTKRRNNQKFLFGKKAKKPDDIETEANS